MMSLEFLPESVKIIFGTTLVSSLFSLFKYMFFFFALFFGLAIYVYSALAWMNIAKRMKYKYPWIAWIPIANLFLFPILAKKHWIYGFLLLIPVVNFVFTIIWFWKILELRGYKGELSLIYIGLLIPYLYFFALFALFVVFGFLAWGKGKRVRKKRK